MLRIPPIQGWYWRGMLLTIIVVIGLDILRFMDRDNVGIVILVLGFPGIRFFRTDFRNYWGKSALWNFWLTEHLQRTQVVMLRKPHFGYKRKVLTKGVRYFNRRYISTVVMSHLYLYKVVFYQSENKMLVLNL